MKQPFTHSSLLFTLLATIFSVAFSFGQTITEVEVTPATVCPGSSVSVKFKPTTVPAGTTFTAQLSDAAGSFATPAATATGTASPISVAIPANAAAGTGYKARVISATPAITGTESNPFTINAIPAAPTATSPVVYTQGATAVALSATGTGLLWYDADNGGTGSGAIPVPSTATVGTKSYYVSQTSAAGCESARTKIDVTVNACTPPAKPTVANKNYTVGDAAGPLEATPNTGLLWYTASTGGTGSATAPTPSTAAAGTKSYFVSQVVSGCESERAEIIVTVTACTPPAKPTVANKSYTVGEAAEPLKATPNTGLLWYTASTGGTGSATAPTPSTATAGTKSYYVSQVVSGCESERAEIVVTVNVCTPPAKPTVANKSYTVGDAAGPLEATPNTGLLWYTASTGGTGSATAPTPSTATAGTKSYYVSQVVSGCESDRAEIVVTVNACTPPAKPTVANKSYTVGDAAGPLEATPNTGLLWYTASTGGTGSATAPTPSTATAGTKSYYVSQVVSGCESERAEIIVTVTACTPPAKPTVANKSYTVGDAAGPLEATPNTGLLWYTASTGGTGSATAPTPSTATAGTKSYYVSRVVNSCESERVEIIVTVNACTPPAKPTVANKNYTVGEVADPLTANPNTGLLWYTASTGGTGSTTAPTPSTATVGTKSYYVSRVVNSCESERVEIVVTISACTPPAAPTVANVNYFLGQTPTALTATATNNTHTLKWYTVATGGTATTAAPTPSTAAAGVTNYYVSQTNASGCESARAQIVVTVAACPATIPLPTVATPLNICQAPTASALTATPTNNTYTLRWYTGATGGTGSTTAIIPNAATAGTTSYYVSQVSAAGCESARVKIDVVVNATPAMPTVTPIDYCVGEKATALTPAGGNYKWYTLASGGTGSATGPLPATTTPGTSSFYLSQSSTYGSLVCESPRAKQDVIVNATPAPLPTLSDVFCQSKGDSTYKFPTAASQGNTLNWYTAATGGTASAATPTLNAKTPGEFTFYATQLSGKGCESATRVIQKVRVKPLPGLPTIEKSLIEYCQFIKANPLTATPATNGILNWYNTGTGGTPSATAPTPSTAEGGTTSFYVSQTLEGCISDRAKVDVKINTTPKPTTTTYLEYCQNAVAPVLSATGTVLKWYREADGTEWQGVPFTPFTEKVSDYSFYVTQTGTTNGCESPKEEIKVHIKSLPSATISGTSTVELGNTANLTIKFTGDGPWSYALSNGVTNTTDQSTHQVQVKPTTTTTYLVTEVSNACGKGIPIGSAVVTVKVPTINSGNPSVSEACAGKTFNVPFQQSGDFPTGNTFKVQISKTNVDAQFKTIPSVISGNSVNATFPDTTSGGSYFIRVISSGTNPEFTVKGSVSAITIIASPLPVATLTGTQTILVGGSATLKADITGKGPWTITLNNGTKDSLITATATPFTFTVTPKATTTFAITKVTNGCGNGTGVGVARVQVDPILGVEPPASDWVKVYPTVVDSRVTIEITGVISPKQASVEVIDLNGRPRAKEAIQGKITEVNLGNYPSGLYLLRIQNGNSNTVQRVMKP
ncbi:T9SS type A sorting domain-containing protein [Dyadobacter sp. CY323]|uniref:Ig-like domain-containing protein n=1 Tax=Dyadobacter sp. CY323 TaxID=2907302 RepID=UPI001F3E2034|nr:T9SS type A sorting domain-containing protein [Dyadobacter sp. CY323]MCE6988598.1 T9SS type A sorting domain-containing protein [Dyadobacter sp. CY323]